MLAPNSNDVARLSSLRAAEAQAAKAYWTVWAGVALRFSRRDADRVPASWQSFGTRRSPSPSGPRLAATPWGTRSLNYLYALAGLGGRARIRAVGLDPGIGIVHADQRSRDSLALDLLKAGAPTGRCSCSTCSRHTFTAATSTRAGAPPSASCRRSRIALAETLPAWAELFAPLAEEQVAETLLRGEDPRCSARREQRWARGPSAADREPPNRPCHGCRASCRSCGGEVEGNRAFCDACLVEERADQLPTFQAAGPAALARLSAQGDDPRATPQARQKLGRAISRRLPRSHRMERAERPSRPGHLYGRDPSSPARHFTRCACRRHRPLRPPLRLHPPRPPHPPPTALASLRSSGAENGSLSIAAK